jgi:hypothetical protein
VALEPALGASKPPSSRIVRHLTYRSHVRLSAVVSAASFTGAMRELADP